MGFYDCTKSHARCENVTDIVIWDCLTFRVKTVIFCIIDITYVRGINYENKIVYLLIIWAYSSQCATNLCVLVLTCITTKRITDLEWQLTKFLKLPYSIHVLCMPSSLHLAQHTSHIWCHWVLDDDLNCECWALIKKISIYIKNETII